jgi:hypothetical protein
VSHLELQPVVVGESHRAVLKITNSGALPCSYSIAPKEQQQQQQQQLNGAEDSGEHDGGAAVPLTADSSEVSTHLLCTVSLMHLCSNIGQRWRSFGAP